MKQEQQNKELLTINSLPLTVNSQKSSSQRGFTLVELMVVAFIMVILSTISVANFRQGEKRKRTAIAADMVVNAIRTAQNFTLTGKNTNNANPACRVPEYYLVTFNYTNTFSVAGYNNCDTVDVVETYSIPANSRIKASGLVLGSTPAVTNMSIMFLAPFAIPKALTDGGTIYNTFTTATIAVESADGTVVKTVTVDGVAGRIGE